MSRSSSGIVAGLVVLGCVVAMLPAQDSSRRTASKYRPNAVGAPAERPSLAPLDPAEADLPPVVNAPARSATSSTRSNFVPAPQADIPTSDQLPPSTAVPQDPVGTHSIGAPHSSPAADAPAADLDDTRLHSVLKRPRPLAQEAVPPGPPPSLSPAPSHSVTSVPGSSLGPQLHEAPASLSAVPSTSTNVAPQPTDLPRRSIGASSLTTDSIQNSKSKTHNSTASATSKSAALKVDITGPQGLTVGKPALYVVTVNNESDTAADEVHLRIPLPGFVTVQTTQPTSGEASVQPDGAGAARLMWLLPHVAGRSREQLKVQLVTGVGDSFDLAAEWTVRPAVARAAIQIKQPQLALALAGPGEMVFGEEKAFTLTVSNPGTGDAEHVVVSVTAANAPPQQFDAGLIPAGHKKEVPLAVVASQPGTIELQIAAAGEGGLEARTAGKVIVRKAEINVAIDGPPLKYAGSEAVYVVTVTNSGTAAADNVNLTLTLPPGAKYLGGLDGSSATATGVKWKIANLPARNDRQYEVRLQLSSPGANRIAIQSQAAASGTADGAAETLVEAVSDLKLVVQDPSGPLPTGEPATYELQIMNRGTQAARQVKVVMQFSDGVEPVGFEGCEARIVPGQIVCHPLPQLGAGEQATVRIKAKATNPGSHHFRVEVTTTDGDARLVTEGTTRFFADSGRTGAAASTARKPTLVPNTSIPTTVR
jgi:uncharacterized repeat protein (TIGR01451 family)